MRKGARRNDWTCSELAYLREMAGVASRRDICRHLRRSAKSVQRKADRLRAEGEDDDGYDPYSDRPADNPLFERDPWN